jgi:hypothetical protein
MIIPKHWCIFSSAANKRSKKVVKPILFLVLLLCGTSHLSFGDESTPQANSVTSLDTVILEKNHAAQYQVGDRIQFSAVLPYELISKIRSLQLKQANNPETTEGSGIYLDPTPQVINGSLRYSVSPLKPGKLTIPEINVIDQTNGMIAKTQSYSIDVAELKTESKEEPQLLDPVSLSIPFRWIVFGILLLAGFVAVCYFLYKRYLQRKVPPPVMSEVRIPPVPDHEIALRDLNSLYERYPYSGDHLKPVAFGVSQILKNFFSARFKIDARESTTDEMIALLRQESLPDPELKRIIRLFTDLDQIKFTDYQHHSGFQKSDYLGFKESSKDIIQAWTIRDGGGK